MERTAEELAAWISAAIRQFVLTSPGNNLGRPDGEPVWDAPLVGFSRGDDALYELFKEVVGPYHWTPCEAFRVACPERVVQPGELTVISWVLPHTVATRADNSREADYPAERWVRSKIFGEALNHALRRYVVSQLRLAGYAALAPSICAAWKEHPSADGGAVSPSWSERHAAFASGLGTFGLCDGLITPLGKAVRLGSVVAQIGLPATARPYGDHHSYCLFFSTGACGKCIERCPVGAISHTGHDIRRCREHAQGAAPAYVEREYGLVYGPLQYGCGLCQTGVPCESGIP
jgi:ferredoxin